MKICPGCNREVSNDTWFHPELGICSICYNIHEHSNFQKWDAKKKKWVPKRKQNHSITEFIK